MISFSDPNRTLTGLHDMLTGWRSIRAQRRMRYSPAASSSPSASMHADPVAGPPPTAGPDTATVIGYRKLGDRIVPIFGDPAELGDAVVQASANTAPTPSETRAAETPPEAPPAAPEASQGKPPPPPDFTPQAVEASAPRQRPAVPPTLDLPPPTPPHLVRVEEQAVTLERVLAQHAKLTQVLLAQHSAMTEAIFAEHRRAQAQADLEQRQQIADLLAKHQITAEAASEHGQALTNLRELLAEQASAMQAEHARITDKIESIVDMVGMVGETVHEIAVAALQPRPLPLGVLPTRQGSTVAAGGVDRPAQAPQSVAASAPRILPARPPSTEAVQPASPAAAAPSVQPLAANAETVQPAAPTPAPRSTPEAAAPAGNLQAVPTANATATHPRPAAVPVRGGPDSAPPVATNTSRDESTLSRSLGFIPAAADVLSLASRPPTPRQLREAEAARERSRLDEALADHTLDDCEEADEPNAGEVRNA
ncbi:MAG: hypothetical protein JNL82_08090 [Myxococcales bacterium]|nr:hypothetical protein [Myxococcales bacterium]